MDAIHQWIEMLLKERQRKRLGKMRTLLLDSLYLTMSIDVTFVAGERAVQCPR